MLCPIAANFSQAYYRPMTLQDAGSLFQIFAGLVALGFACKYIITPVIEAGERRREADRKEALDD